MEKRKQVIINTAVEYSFLANTITDISQPQVLFLSNDTVLLHCSVDINESYQFNTLQDAIGKSRLVHFWGDFNPEQDFPTLCDSIIVRDLGSNNSVRFKRQKLGRFQNDLLMKHKVQPEDDIYQAFLDNIKRILNKEKSISVDMARKGSEAAMAPIEDEFSESVRTDKSDDDIVNHAKGELSGGGYSIDGSDDNTKQTSTVYVDEPSFSRCQFLNIRNEFGLYDNTKSEQTFTLEYLLFLFNYRAALQNIILDVGQIDKIAKSKKNPYSEFYDYYKKQKNTLLGVLAGQIFFMVNDIFKNSKIVISNTGNGCICVDVLTENKVSDMLNKSKFAAEFIGANFTGASNFSNWLMWRFGITIPDNLIKRFLVNVPGFKPIKDVRKWLDDFGSDLTGDARNPRKDVAFALALLLGLNLSGIRRHLLCDIAALFHNSRYDFWAVLLSNCMHIWFLKTYKNIKITNVSDNINTANFTNFVLIPGIYKCDSGSFLGLVPCIISSKSSAEALSLRIANEDYYLLPSAVTGITGVTSESFIGDVKEYLQHDTITVSSLGCEIRSETLASNKQGYIAGYDYIVGLMSKFKFGLLTNVDSYGIKTMGASSGINNDVLELDLEADYYFKVVEGADSGLTSSYQQQSERASGNDKERTEYNDSYDKASFDEAKRVSDKYANTAWDTFVQTEQAIQQSVQQLFNKSIPQYFSEDAGGVQYNSTPQEVYFTND